jgi:lipopolysaccharide/colanic/teichoic acid biosynthesis glycosyltransferase
MLILAVAVKATSRGPAFYLQTRLGRHGAVYRIIKLRTMVQDAEAGTGAVWAKKDDNRITPIGRFLRGTHLDELPQLWNVLKGEMSLIGPRPERPEIARRIERQIPGFRGRLLLRPGITGLAQMSLPADDPQDHDLTGVRAKLAHDLYYVREVNFLLDLRIAISTPCYFLAAAVDGVRRALVRSCGVAIRDDSTIQHGIRKELNLAAGIEAAADRA